MSFTPGLSKPSESILVIDAEYIWKYTTRAFDFSVLDNTPITYPIEWANSKIPGYRHPRERSELPWFDGIRRHVQRGGAFLSVRRSAELGPHRSRQAACSASITTKNSTRRLTSNTSRQKKLPWVGINWRYDSGLVAGALPYAGAANYDPVSGNCIGCTITNGPNGVNGAGSNDVVDASGLTPDQQFQAGLYCGNRVATPTTPSVHLVTRPESLPCSELRLQVS